MKRLSDDVEHVIVPEGVLLYRTSTDRWYLAEGEAAAAVTGPRKDSAGLDTLRAVGLAPGAPRTNGQGRVQELTIGVALTLLAAALALTPGSAFAASASYSAPSSR